MTSLRGGSGRRPAGLPRDLADEIGLKLDGLLAWLGPGLGLGLGLGLESELGLGSA